MPCGRTVTIWAICDKCQCCVEDMNERGSVRDIVSTVRASGWKVRRDGTVICDECQAKMDKEKTGD